jgi:hypothetical protein
MVGRQAFIPLEGLGIMLRLCIITRDRPDRLQRLLKSSRDFISLYAQDQLMVCVYDDSRSLRMTQQTHTIVQGFSAGLSIAFRFSDHATRLNACRQISRSKREIALLAWALSGDDDLLASDGAIRNAALLDAGGSPLLFIDDDVEFAGCKTATCERIFWSNTARPHDWIFFESEQVLGRSVPVFPLDLVAAHLETAETIRSSLSQQEDSGNKHQSLIGQTLLTTQMGILGDSGDAVRTWPLYVPGQFANERHYQLAKLSRNVLLSVSSPAVTRQPYCQALSLAVYDPASVPPFFPRGRNSDGLFAHMLHRMRPEGLFAHVPFTVRHHSDGRPSYTASEIFSAVTKMRNSDLLLAIMNASQMPQSYDHPTTLGLRFSALGSMNIRDFNDFMHDVIVNLFNQRISRLECLLANRFHYLSCWETDALKCIRLLRRPVSPNALPITFDSRHTNPDNAFLLRLYLVRYGWLLTEWGNLLHPTKTLANALSLNV